MFFVDTGKTMVQIALVRPGSTDYDIQGRIQGNLDIPLNEMGRKQAASAVDQAGAGLEDRARLHVQAPASAAFTAALTWPMSALPASRVLTAPITLPMSPGPLAPSSATIARTSTATSSALMRCGR